MAEIPASLRDRCYSTSSEGSRDQEKRVTVEQPSCNKPSQGEWRLLKQKLL
jgi:hypothetical protein